MIDEYAIIVCNMNYVRSGALPETFAYGGLAIDFDRSACLPPDAASVAIGCEAASVVNALRMAAAEPAMPVRALELGTGSGVCLAALIHNVRRKEVVHLTGLDIDEAAVDITRHNIAKEAGNAAVVSDIFTGDWHDEAVWRRIGRQTYDVIVCNPPYLAPDTALMEGYEAVPRTALYAEGNGLAHHRFLMPRLLGMLSLREGATLIARFHSTLRGQYELSQEIDRVVNEAVVQSPPVSDLAIVRTHLAPVAPGRNLAKVTISRSESSTPLHMRPPYAR